MVILIATSAKSKNAKADRDILCHSIVSMESRRNVNLDKPLQQELCSIPLALAAADSALHSTNKAELASIFAADGRNPNLPMNFQDK